MSRFIFHAAHDNYCATAASHALDSQCCWYPQQLPELNEIQEPRNGHFKLLVCVEYQLLPVFSSKSPAKHPYLLHFSLDLYQNPSLTKTLLLMKTYNFAGPSCEYC